MTPEELETKVDELKYQFDENFGRAVARKEETMLAFEYHNDDKEQRKLAVEFQKHLALKGFDVELKTKRYKGAKAQLWADLTFNY